MVLINPAPNPNPNPAQGCHFFDPSLPGLNSVTPPAPSSSLGAAVNTMPFQQYKKYRKPYRMTKSRESWSDQEHDKFLEAVQLFDRDWKKIEAFVGSKSVIQIRSHAQKYFQKVQKSGTKEHVPPPRPKRKASHPYPHKAPKNAPVVPQVSVPSQCSSVLLEPGYVNGLESSRVPAEPVPSSSLSLWNYDNVPAVGMPQVTTEDVRLADPVVQNCCHSSTSKDSSPKTWSHDETISRGDFQEPVTVSPDFSQVYSFIGSIFDPNATDHLQRLKQMDPINRETALLLMRNLTVNLMKPEFETHRRLLSSFSRKKKKACRSCLE